MLSAYNAKGRQVIARNVTKEEGPFSCPECGSEVTLKKGVIVVHHFAHIPPFTCSYGQGESEEHRASKLEVYDALLPSPKVSWLMVERSLDDVRLDVSCYVRKKHLLTVELQYSDKSPNEIGRRTSLYTARKIHVLWLLPYPDDLWEGVVYATTLMERYMHALYFGYVYYWRDADIVLPVHYRKQSLKSIYDESYVDEEERWYTGKVDQFPKKYSRYPEFHEEIRITDLKPFTRHAGLFGPYTLPAARLWGLDKP